LPTVLEEVMGTAQGDEIGAVSEFGEVMSIHELNRLVMMKAQQDQITELEYCYDDEELIPEIHMEHEITRLCLRLRDTLVDIVRASAVQSFPSVNEPARTRLSTSRSVAMSRGGSASQGGTSSSAAGDGVSTTRNPNRSPSPYRVAPEDRGVDPDEMMGEEDEEVVGFEGLSTGSEVVTAGAEIVYDRDRENRDESFSSERDIPEGNPPNAVGRNVDVDVVMVSTEVSGAVKISKQLKIAGELQWVLTSRRKRLRWKSPKKTRVQVRAIPRVIQIPQARRRRNESLLKWVTMFPKKAPLGEIRAGRESLQGRNQRLVR
jgi:hypothetical protein